MATEVTEVTVVATEAIEAMGDMEVMVATVEATAEVMEVTVEATEAMADTDTANDLQMPSPNPSLRPAQLLYRKLTLRPNRKRMLRPMPTHTIIMHTPHLTMANNIILPRGQPNLSLEVQEVMEVGVMDMGAMEAVLMEVITAEVGDIMEATDPMEGTKATVVMVAITNKVPLESSYSILTSKVKT